MKLTSVRAAIAALGTVFAVAGLSTPTFAAVEAEAAQALAKKSDCFKCHAVDKSKKGPSMKKIAEKYKGKADAEAKLTAFLSKGGKVKVDGAHVGDSPVSRIPLRAGSHQVTVTTSAAEQSKEAVIRDGEETKLRFVF